jgi:DNA-binding NarL/FixJ family response regulator
MKRTVLIVDDSASFRSAARLLFESEGYEVLGEASDGASALACERKLRPELVLLDVKLPDTDGFAVAGELTRRGDAPGVILTSSHDASDFGPLIEQSGARGFVPKSELTGSAIAAFLRRD